MTRRRIVIAAIMSLGVVLGLAGAAEATYVDAINVYNPTGYWRMGELSGSTAFDLSGNNVDGTYVGGVTLGQAGAIVGDDDTAVMFDAVTGYVHVDSSDGIEIAGDVTVSLWINVEELSGDQTIITYSASGNTAKTNTLYELSVGSDGLLTYRHEKGRGTDYTYTFTAAPLSAGTWYHVAFARSKTSKEVKLYVNDTNVDTFSYSQNPNNGKDSSLYIGSNLGTSDFFGGRIDEVAIFDSTLDAFGIAAIYSAGIVEIPEPNTVIYLGAVLPVLYLMRGRSQQAAWVG